MQRVRERERERAESEKCTLHFRRHMFYTRLHEFDSDDMGFIYEVIDGANFCSIFLYQDNIYGSCSGKLKENFGDCKPSPAPRRGTSDQLWIYNVNGGD